MIDIFETVHDPMLSRLYDRKPIDDMMWNSLIQKPIVIDEVGERPLIRIIGLLDAKPVNDLGMSRLRHCELDSQEMQSVKTCPIDNEQGGGMDYAI